MTNHWTDIGNADVILIMGSNAAENHPISFHWVTKAMEKGATLIHVDPRFTRTSAKANIYAPMRSGTDIAFLGGMVKYIVEDIEKNPQSYNLEYLKEYTNAGWLIDAKYSFSDGIFSGYDAASRAYKDKSGWQYQKYAVESGRYVREHFWGAHPALLDMVRHHSDEQLKKLRLGGHDPIKVYNAYQAAVAHRGAPTVVLARTIKGYGLGEAGEGKNITHQQKKMNEDELRAFRTRFGIPISDDQIKQMPFYRPPDDSPEMQYLRERRQGLGGGGWGNGRHFRRKIYCR